MLSLLFLQEDRRHACRDGFAISRGCRSGLALLTHTADVVRHDGDCRHVKPDPHTQPSARVRRVVRDAEGRPDRCHTTRQARDEDDGSPTQTLLLHVPSIARPKWSGRQPYGAGVSEYVARQSSSIARGPSGRGRYSVGSGYCEADEAPVKKIRLGHTALTLTEEHATTLQGRCAFSEARRTFPRSATSFRRIPLLRTHRCSAGQLAELIGHDESTTLRKRC